MKHGEWREFSQKKILEIGRSLDDVKRKKDFFPSEYINTLKSFLNAGLSISSQNFGNIR